jgi:predicted acetyltransferase
MEEITVRPIKDEQELETVYRVWETAFPEEKQFFERRLQSEDKYDPETTWVAAVEGEIGAAVQVFPYKAWMSDIQVKIAGIGNVATLPQYRGRGLTHAILHEQIKWMYKQGYDLSLLYTGIPAFYEKAGWHTVEELFYNVPLKNIQLDTELAFAYTIASFSDQDLDGVRQVYRSCNKHRTGARIRTEEYWQKLMNRANDPHADFLTAKESGRIIAYVWTGNTNESEMQIQELCYAEGGEAAALSLVKEIIQRHPAAESTRLAVPAGHVLVRVLEEQGIQSEKSGEAMWRVLNEREFFRKVTALLTKRILKEGRIFQELVHSRMAIRITGYDTQLVIIGGKAGIEELGRTEIYENKIEVTEGEWLKMVLRGAQHAEDQNVRENALLQALFPEQGSILWKPDRF